MTKTEKITLATTRDIPFNKLVLSQANVRTIKTGVSIEELAEDIVHRGLLQSLSVRPVKGADGKETGMYEVHRTWLAPGGAGKARVASPRRAMGVLLGQGVRFGFDDAGEANVIAAGEGLETMLSLRMALPALPVIAGLSTAHLGALMLPPTLRRLYIAADADGAGRAGTQRLGRRAREAGIETLTLRPVLGDFNDDLRGSGAEALRLHLLPQLAPGDADRFLV